MHERVNIINNGNPQFLLTYDALILLNHYSNFKIFPGISNFNESNTEAQGRCEEANSFRVMK